MGTEVNFFDEKVNPSLNLFLFLRTIDDRLISARGGLENLVSTLQEKDRSHGWVKKQRKKQTYFKRKPESRKGRNGKHSYPTTRKGSIAFANCHPGEKHFSFGLCKRCYETYKRKTAPPASCHPKRRVFRKGICKQCYRKERGYK